MNIIPDLIKSMTTGSVALGNSSSDGGLATVLHNLAAGSTSLGNSSTFH